MAQSDIEKSIKTLIQKVQPYGWTPGFLNDIRKTARSLDTADLREYASSYIDTKEKNLLPYKEEYVVLLVFLTLTEQRDPVSLSALVHRHLQDKLIGQDVNFLVHALLGDHIPLPRGLVYDITERLLLNIEVMYAKIVKDFKKVPSRNTEKVILFLTLHYCRKDLNTQNKEMIGLILAHIRADVPPELTDDVKDFLIATFMKEIEASGKEMEIEESLYTELQERSQKNEVQKRETPPPKQQEVKSPWEEMKKRMEPGSSAADRGTSAGESRAEPPSREGEDEPPGREQSGAGGASPTAPETGRPEASGSAEDRSAGAGAQQADQSGTGSSPEENGEGESGAQPGAPASGSSQSPSRHNTEPGQGAGSGDRSRQEAQQSLQSSTLLRQEEREPGRRREAAEAGPSRTTGSREETAADQQTNPAEASAEEAAGPQSAMEEDSSAADHKYHFTYESPSANAEDGIELKKLDYETIKNKARERVREEQKEDEKGRESSSPAQQPDTGQQTEAAALPSEEAGPAEEEAAEQDEGTARQEEASGHTEEETEQPAVESEAQETGPVHETAADVREAGGTEEQPVEAPEAAPAGGTPEAEEPAGGEEAGKEEAGEEKRDTGKRRKLPAALGTVLGVLLLAGAGAFFALRPGPDSPGSGGETAQSPESGAPAAEESSAAESPAESPAEGQPAGEDVGGAEPTADAASAGGQETAGGPAAAEGEPVVLSSGGEQYTFYLGEGQVQWQPSPGDHFYKLFTFLQGYEGAGPSSVTAIGELTWQDFLANLRRFNPGIGQLDLIYPEGLYTIARR